MDLGQLLQQCTHEFASYVDFVFDAAATLPGSDDFRTAPFLEIPVIGQPGQPGFFAGHESAALRQAVFNALCARAQFNGEKPDWAPDLPLRWHECRKLENSDNLRSNLVGLFASSQYSAEWDLRHPTFTPFVSGLMAYDRHSGPASQRPWPAVRISCSCHRGACDGFLHWRRPR